MNIFSFGVHFTDERSLRQHFKEQRDHFTGITESDEAFFLRSEKGMEVKGRKPRKRGGKSTKRGISDDQVAVIATQDRKSGLDLSVATLGRIGKADIANAIGERIKKGSTILCSDSHHSYRASPRIPRWSSIP